MSTDHDVQVVSVINVVDSMNGRRRSACIRSAAKMRMTESIRPRNSPSPRTTCETLIDATRNARRHTGTISAPTGVLSRVAWKYCMHHE